MILEGDISVIDAIKEKKRLMDAGEPHDHIRPLLIIGGGLMKGAYGVGACAALRRHGLTEVFTSVGGVSSGAVTAASVVSGDIEEGKKVLYIDACNGTFLHRWRLWNVLDPLMYEAVMRGETGRVTHPQRCIDSAQQLFIGLADYQTAAPIVVEPDSVDELFTVIRASITIPGATNIPAYVRGVRCVDGAAGYPVTYEDMVDRAQATHVLHLTNQDQATIRTPLFERLLFNTVWRFVTPPTLRRSICRRYEHRQQFWQEQLQSSATPTLIAWGDGSIDGLEQDAAKVQGAIERSQVWWDRFLADHQSFSTI